MSFIHDIRRQNHFFPTLVYSIAIWGTLVPHEIRWQGFWWSGFWFPTVLFLARAIVVLWHTEDEWDNDFASDQEAVYGFRVPFWVERYVFYHGLRAQLILLLALSAFGVEWAEAAFCAAVGADAVFSHLGPSLWLRRYNAGSVPTGGVYLLIAALGAGAIATHLIIASIFAGQFLLIWIAVFVLGRFFPTRSEPVLDA